MRSEFCHRLKSKAVLAVNMRPIVKSLDTLRRLLGSKPKKADLNAVRSSAIFDHDWYRRTQAPDLSADADPIEHYLTEGAALGLNPGPLFDSAWYLKQNPDVARGGMNPLVHFWAHGRHEGRLGKTVTTTNISSTQQRISLITTNIVDAKMSVVVVVHSFYPNIFAEIALRLRNLPYRFTLLVGIPSHEDEMAIVQMVADAKLNADLRCKVIPNRGRNFGTLLPAFGKEVCAHDIVLHLHTKRSLYTGAEQSNWRQTIFDGLIGAPLLVEGLLNLFHSDKKLGLFYTSPYRGLPYWANHWLSNLGSGSALLERLGVRRYPRSGYFDFPVGGMFWARVEALRPLLESNIQYIDFDEERGQTDGTLAHAIERVIGILPAANGFGFIEHDPQHGHFNVNWSERNASQYNSTSLISFAEKIKGINLVSFDLFDTLIVRPALTPDAVLRFVGHKINLGAPNKTDFFPRRKEAENKARASKDWKSDVTLDEIYAHFATDEAWTREAIADASRLERSTDTGLLRLRPGAADLIALVQQACCRIVAISDSYYSYDEIVTILQVLGIRNIFDEIYVSSHIGKRKDRGDLWTHVLAHEEHAPDGWLHVGDNEHSDIQAACDRGLRFFHVMNPGVQMIQDGFSLGKVEDGQRWAADLVVGPAMLKIAGTPFRDGRAWRSLPLINAEEVGYVIYGPIIYLFMSWLIRHPAARLVDHLFFLSREGYILHKIYEFILNKFPEKNLPASSYFYTSRRSAIAAAQSKRFDSRQIVSGAGFRGTLHDLLKSRIGLDAPNDYGFADWDVLLPDDEQEVTLAINLIEKEIVAHVSPEAQALAAYASSEGMVASRVSAIVDIGYSATIQKNLQVLLGIPLVGFYMGSFDAAAGVEVNGGVSFGCFCEDIPAWSSTDPVLAHSLLMEAFLTAPHGQVLSFGKHEDPKPVFKKSSLAESDVKNLEAMHDGALRYCQELIELFGYDLIMADIELSVPQEFLRMMADKIIHIPPTVGDTLHVEDEFCGNGKLAVFN
ncbi:rhamnan synthesis F family protein [Methylobacterium sp. E-045]|uniref:rhamnan synthesis F family protein n=1 Tax=Methylobacterium sp. E-045 TaxID=2836575 RepID=UPI001FB9F5B2|nr:rhamnan synthesis F family protein [Methylobacterium sp. E-045]MCJ2131288.1 HAD hydrolase-like protein [Methylobacterium sp. E-045]